MVVIDDVGDGRMDALAFGYRKFAEQYPTTLTAEGARDFTALSGKGRRRVIDAAWRLYGEEEMLETLRAATEKLNAALGGFGVTAKQAAQSLQQAMAAMDAVAEANYGPSTMINCRCVTDVTAGEPLAILDPLPKETP